MERNIMNTLDAFRALEDISDDEILPMLAEGRGFSIRSASEMAEAEEYKNASTGDDTTLEVIDVDTDSLEHMRKAEDYIGQVILQCNTCKSNHFINFDDLVADETVADRYNVEDECPHCHAVGTGYTLIGQVGKMVNEPVAEVTNDSLTAEDNVGFDNDLTPEEEPAAEELPAVEPEAAKEEAPAEEEELGDLETTAEDDTADMETAKLGDEFKREVPLDDTEEYEEEESEEEIENERGEEDEFDAELKAAEKKKKEEAKEALNEAAAPKEVTVAEFLEKFAEPEQFEDILIYNADAEDPENPMLKGSLAKLKEADLMECVLKGFNTGDGLLIINVDTHGDLIEGEDSVESILNMFTDDFSDNITLWDAASNESLYSGTKDTCINVFGNYPVTYLERPARLVLICKAGADRAAIEEINEDLDLANPEDLLISNIITENNLTEYRVSKEGSIESALAESIRMHEDLESVYNHFVKGKSIALENAFKEVTGYKDELERLTEQQELEEAVAVKTEDEMLEAAKKAIADANAFAAIYGYQKNGKFYPIDPLIIVPSKDAYADKCRIAQLRYKPTGSIRTLFAHSVSLEDSYHSRAELKDAIKECQENYIPYSVKSLGKNQYKLIKESFEDEVEEEEVEETDPAIIEVQPSDIEFDEVEFENFINEYLDRTLDDTYTFEASEGGVTGDGAIEIKGNIVGELTHDPIIFVLTPLTTKNEALEEGQSFEVSNNLNEDVLCFKSKNRILPENFIITDEEGNETEIVEPEELETLPGERPATSTALADPRDVALVDKLTRISLDTAEAIKDTYGIENVDARLILADMIRDLRLISGDLKPEDLENTPMDQLTKVMYQAYDGFCDEIDDCISAITGNRISTSQQQRLLAAIESLDMPQFSTEAIRERVRSDEFRQALTMNAVPGVSLSTEDIAALPNPNLQ